MTAPIFSVSRKSALPQASLEWLSKWNVTPPAENKLEVRASGDAFEMDLLGSVGKDWDGNGITEKEVRDAFRSIPAGKKIKLNINSPGGYVYEGLGIHSAIKDRSADVACRITGYALSAASFFPLAAGKVISPKSSIWMIHPAQGFAWGSGDDMRKQADMMDVHDKAIVGIYQEKTGKSENEIRAAMTSVTWMTGDEAIAWGLAEPEEEEKTESKNLAAVRRGSSQNQPAPAVVPASNSAAHTAVSNPPPDANAAPLSPAVNPPPVNTAENQQPKTPMPDTTTPAAAQPAAPANNDVLANVQAQLAAERKARITAEVTRRAENKITNDKLNWWIESAVKDEAGTLAQIDALPSAKIGSDPIGGNRIEVTDSNESILNAFAAEKDPKARAAIYNKEISPRVRSGNPMPLPKNSNSLGTLVGTLVSQRTLELLKFQFPVLGAVTTDFSDAGANYGQTVATRIISVPTVQTYNTSTGWASSDATATDVTISLNAHKGVPITFGSNELSGTVRRLFDELAPAQAYALAKDMVDALYANITAANFTNTATTQAVATFGRNNVIDMGTALTLRGVPMGSMNRTLLLYSTYFGQLAKDNAIVTLSAFQNKDIIEAGVLPDVHGFKVVDAPNLPAGSDYIVGFGFSKSALAIATRVPNDYTTVLPGASYGNVSIVTDPDLGISVQQVQYVDHKLGTATQRIALMYGVAKGQINAGQLLTSQ